MLVVRIELWPQGNKKSARLIEQIVIANVGGTQELGDYDVWLGLHDPHVMAESDWADGEVKAHPRLTESVWSLVKKAIDSLGGT